MNALVRCLFRGSIALAFILPAAAFAQDSLNVRRLGQLSYSNYVTDVAVAGNYAYVACSYSGLRIVNVANPSVPVEVGFYQTPGQSYGVAVAGSYAYVADGTSGLRIVNISNPAAPFEAGFYDTPGFALGVAVSGNYAYVADGGFGLRIVNIANPAAPFEVGF